MEGLEELQAREFARQELLEKTIKPSIIRKEGDFGEGGRTFLATGLIFFITNLLYREQFVIRPLSRANEYHEVELFFLKTILPEINAFTDIPEERKLIFTEILSFVTDESLSGLVRREYEALTVLPLEREKFLERVRAYNDKSRVSGK